LTDKDLILAIDNGTQSLKSLIFDIRGKLLARVQVPFEPYYSKKPGWAEQDPAVFWDALCSSLHRLWEAHPGIKDRIAGMALTTQRCTFLNVDQSGNPLRPAIVWPDQRKTHGLAPLGGLWGLLFKIGRLTDTIEYLQAEAEANWIRTHQPDVWRATRKYLMLSGYLTHKLTGEFKDSVGCQVGYIPFDYKNLRWAASWSWRWRCIPMSPDLLPDLVEPAGILGHVTPQAAAETGLPEGLPMVAAAADKACEVIGSGSLDPSIGCLSYGTTATINITHRKYIEPIPLLPAYPSAVPGFYTVEVMVYRGYWMVNWFKEEFGQPEQVAAERLGLTPESLFDDMVSDIPAGSMGLILQPYWTPGLKSPGPEAKGTIIGFGDVHTRAHLYRAILEGLAYALREGRERIERRSGVPITSLRVSGGGSQSRTAMQLTADLFGIPAARPHIYETSGLGAAIDAAVGLKLHPDFDTAVKTMTHTGEVFEPDPKNHRLYSDLYRDVYKKMYRHLKPLYERIREITGYPG